MSTTMVYKHPGKHEIHGDSFDYKIVSSDDVQKALSEGWSLTTTEAKEPAKPKARPKAKPKAKVEAE